MICSNCGSLMIFDDFVLTDLGEVAVYECTECNKWQYDIKSILYDEVSILIEDEIN